VLAIADQHLALVQQVGALGPVDHIVHAVGDVDHLIVIQAHQLCSGNIEIGVVTGDDRIVHHGAGQFHGALHATGNYGIWINDASRRLRFRYP
jgi:hypothetical protein